jgi:sterol desaturase/sphingolipid hydroxylase (fatty acid hydroxylase superfamily)
MNTMIPKNQGSKQLFQNPVLEKLSRTHIAIPLTVFTLYAASLLYWSVSNNLLSPLVTVSLFFVGILTFTWVEYNIHRYIFHMSTKTPKREKIQYVIHGVHHEYPKDKDRLAMPPLLSITISTALLFLFRPILGDFVFAFLPGFLVGYALYLAVHYSVHACAPPKNFLRYWWISHSVHHYKDGAVDFGVSSPLWDFVYGTSTLRLKSKTGK